MGKSASQQGDIISSQNRCKFPSDTSATASNLTVKGTKEGPYQSIKLTPKKKQVEEETRNSGLRCSELDGHGPGKCGALNSRSNACRKMGHLTRVCKSSTKNPQECHSNQNTNQGSHKKPKKKDQKVQSLKTEWLS